MDSREESKDYLVEVRNLKKFFQRRRGILGRGEVVKAVDGVSLNIKRGELFGIVGESGSGKTTTAKCLLRLIEPTEGKIYFEGKDILDHDKDEIRSLRRETQMIFQDPYSSLNPKMKVGEIVAEPLRIHHIGNKKEQDERAKEMLKVVGLNLNEMEKYPHEFSGGQRQRIAIARALILNPKFIAADEPVSFLDVLIQAQIINLMLDLQETYGLTYLFISHDMGVIKFVSDRVAVMYRGKIMEVARSRDLYRCPVHPYTKMLFDSLEVINIKHAKGGVVNTGAHEVEISSGCGFYPHCGIRKLDCKSMEPELQGVEKDHLVACHYR